MPKKPFFRFILFSLTLSACSSAPTIVIVQERSQPQSPAEISYITNVLNRIQARSIAENREYCGYLGLNPAGEFVISRPKRGSPAGCTLNAPPPSMRLLASYHTHGAYAFQYDSEVPSYSDLEADIEESTDGYISTPGGRVWFTDSSAEQAILLCGLDCVFSDPNFRPDPDFRVLNRYTLDGLWERQDF